MSTITFTFEDEAFTLEYSRRSVRTMEQTGFSREGLAEKPVTYIPSLFRGAFLMHHPRIKEEKVNTIYNAIDEKEQLINALIDMYRETADSLFDTPDDESKKVKWKRG